MLFAGLRECANDVSVSLMNITLTIFHAKNEYQIVKERKNKRKRVERYSPLEGILRWRVFSVRVYSPL